MCSFGLNLVYQVLTQNPEQLHVYRVGLTKFLSHVILTTPRRAELSQSGNGEGDLKWSAELEIRRRATDSVGSRALSEMVVW